MNAPAWAGKYIGIPFQEKGRDARGVDCWGLVRLVLAQEFAIVAPDYSDDYIDTEHRNSVSAAIGDGLDRDWQRVEHPRTGDLVVFGMGGARTHVGLVMHAPWFLNCRDGVASCLERWDSRMWERSLEGFYRHVR